MISLKRKRKEQLEVDVSEPKEEEKKDEENVLPITISEEDVANWVPDVSDDNLAKQRN